MFAVLLVALVRADETGLLQDDECEGDSGGGILGSFKGGYRDYVGIYWVESLAYAL